MSGRSTLKAEQVGDQTVLQAVSLGGVQYALHLQGGKVALYENLHKTVVREFSFDNLLAITTLQNVMELPCIIVRQKMGVFIFNCVTDHLVPINDKAEHHHEGDF